MARNLAGKVAIVTGGTRGIGAGIACELALRGAKVAITYASENSDTVAAELIQKLSKLHGDSEYPTAIGIRADLRDMSSPTKIVERTIEVLGPTIDILVNNAGVNIPAILDDVTQDLYSEVVDVNFKGLIFMTQAILPHLPQKNGRIINIGSTAARVGYPGIFLYTSTKNAVEGLTRAWAAELGDRNVTVNTISPGSTHSDLLHGLASKEALEFEARNTPVERRLGTPNDIAQVVAWFACEESKWITGQTICASGGFRMY